MRAILSLLLALVLLFPCVCAAESTEAVMEDLEALDNLEEAEMAGGEAPLLSRPLPIDFTPGFPPMESGYTGDWTYEDPTIRVSIVYKDVRQEYDPAYTAQVPNNLKSKEIGVYIVDIEIGDASQLRTLSNKSFSKNSVGSILTIAARVNPVIAFNGDFATRRTEGLIIRQGITYKDQLKGDLDVLQVDEDGDFHVFVKPKRGECTDTVGGKKVINSFYFGPVLVQNGEVPEKLTDFRYLEPDKYYCRMALCQVGPLHYKMILTSMQENNETTGLPLRHFASICRDEGALVAYNLDGGKSASLIFRGELQNKTPQKNTRDVPDIVYFASAWNGEDAE